MKLTFNRDTLAKTLATLRPAVPTRDIKPVLKNVKLVPMGTSVTFTATLLKANQRVTELESKKKAKK